MKKSPQFYRNLRKKKAEEARKKDGDNNSGRGRSGGGRGQGRDRGQQNAKPSKPGINQNEEIRLNRYISAAGVCSRREADTLIADGHVFVDREKITEMGYKVKPGQRVRVRGEEIKPEPFAYVLLHKPKNTITTMSDEKDRPTVMSLIRDAGRERVFPVGRLDRNTTGLLLLTNDGELANRLMHPSHKVRKTYQVMTVPVLSDEQLSSLTKGVKLEDGIAKAAKVTREKFDPSVIVMTVLEGRNRLIRRMIEGLGARVDRLKRIDYAGLRLKGLRPGQWRHLEKEEINDLRKLTGLEALETIKTPNKKIRRR